jgi:hypothetical protein
VHGVFHKTTQKNCLYFQDEEGHEDYNESDSEDEETVLYNPKNLPLGWDGKVGDNSIFLTKCFSVGSLLQSVVFACV